MPVGRISDEINWSECHSLFIPVLVLLTLAYHVNPNNNHDACMQIFSDAGIYLFLDVATHSTQIDGKNPQWTMPQFNAFTAIIEAFSKYDNLAGFFITNEVS
jgi:1,3-beta-glucanosyltransferase GAS1